MRTIRWAIPVGAVVLIGAAAFGVYNGVGAFWKQEPLRIEVRSDSVPKVMQTPGGLLEVSRIDAPAEVLELTDPGTIGPFDFGPNVSRIRVDAVYRYHIPLGSTKWTIIRNGDKVFVIAPKVVPSLPVAIETGTLRQQTEAAWLRFDKEATAKAAQTALTRTLGARASSPSYVEQQREVARKTVSEFVARWGVAPMNSVPPQNIRVVFEDEPIRNLIGAAFDQPSL